MGEGKKQGFDKLSGAGWMSREAALSAIVFSTLIIGSPRPLAGEGGA